MKTIICLVSLLLFNLTSPLLFYGGKDMEKNMNTSKFSSKCISRTSVICLQAPLRTVFPLFGPIKEKEWAEEWNPEIIYTTTNLIEEHMVFKTKSKLENIKGLKYIWTVSKYLPEHAFIEYTVFTPERLWWITIQCLEDSSNQTTEAKITYTFTGLTEDGNTFNEKFLQLIFAHDLKDWEESINHYLKTGEKQKHH